VVQRVIQVGGALDGEFLGIERPLQQWPQRRLAGQLQRPRKMLDPRAVAAEEGEPLGDHHARVEQEGPLGGAEEHAPPARPERLGGQRHGLRGGVPADALEGDVDAALTQDGGLTLLDRGGQPVDAAGASLPAVPGHQDVLWRGPEDRA
jgi:hypothetical protein